MATNPILEEIRETRAQILKEHGDDLANYMHAESERLKSEGHPVAQIEQRKISCAQASTPNKRVETTLSRLKRDR